MCGNTQNSVKTLGGKRSPRESLWVENLRSNNKNVLQDDTTLTTVTRKREVGGAKLQIQAR